MIYFISGLAILYKYPKPQIHIFMNRFHTSFFDTFFYYLTWLGDGIFTVIVIFLMLFFRIRHVFFMASASLVALGIVTICKKFIFDHIYRPHAYFDWVYPYKIHLVKGVDYNGFSSFPSGHTMSVFCTFFALSLIVKNKWLKFIFFVIALFTGYSRVYLSQHFFMDIVAGSLIGVLLTGISFYLFRKINNEWIDLSIIDIIRKS